MTTYDMTRTYELLVAVGRPAIRCRLCQSVSHLPQDIEQRYCSRCHLFHDLIAEARVGVARGAGHECEEWRTARGLCAVCGQGTADPDRQLVEDMAAELIRHEAPLSMVLRPVSAYQLAALLQLALRHPGISAGVRRVGETFIEGVRDYFADAPAILESLRRGDDHDVLIPETDT